MRARERKGLDFRGERASTQGPSGTDAQSHFTQEAWIEAGLKEARRQNQERPLLDDNHRARCGVERHTEGQGSSSPGHWQRLVCDVARKGGGGQRAAATMPG